jgi:hypothetical protein
MNPNFHNTHFNAADITPLFSEEIVATPEKKKQVRNNTDSARLILKLNGYLLQLSEAIVHREHEKVTKYRAIIDTLLLQGKESGYTIILHPETHRYRAIENAELPEGIGENTERQKALNEVKTILNELYAARVTQMKSLQEANSTHVYTQTELITSFTQTVEEIQARILYFNEIQAELEVLKLVMDNVNILPLDDSTLN